MAQAVRTYQESAKYSENVLNIFCSFNNPYTWTTTPTGGLGEITVINSPLLRYKGERGMLFGVNDDCESQVNSGDDSMQMTIEKDGNYILSGRLFSSLAYSSQQASFSFFVYKNGIFATRFDVNLGGDPLYTQFEFGVHNTYFQNIALESGDILDFDFKVSNNSGSFFQFGLDGLKLELDNRGLGFPSRYTEGGLSEVIAPLTQETNEYTLDFPGVAGNTNEYLDVTFTGAIEGDFVDVSVPFASQMANLIYLAQVSATNTIRIKCHNASGSAENPASGLFKLRIIR
jgi:hypothetical protein